MSTLTNYSPTRYFFIGLIWMALGLFGLIFDETKELLITSQLIIGIVFIVYYFWLKLK